MNKILYGCLMMFILLSISGCKEEPYSGDIGPIYEFDQEEYHISSEAQYVDCVLTTVCQAQPYPTEWDSFCAASRVLYDVGKEVSLKYAGISNYWGQLPEGSIQMLECEQFLNSEGKLVLRVHVPANDVEYYRGIGVSTHKGKEFGGACIIQSPKDSDKK